MLELCHDIYRCNCNAWNLVYFDGGVLIITSVIVKQPVCRVIKITITSATALQKSARVHSIL